MIYWICSMMRLQGDCSPRVKGPGFDPCLRTKPNFSPSFVVSRCCLHRTSEYKLTKNRALVSPYKNLIPVYISVDYYKTDLISFASVVIGLAGDIRFLFFTAGWSFFIMLRLDHNQVFFSFTRVLRAINSMECIPCWMYIVFTGRNPQNWT